MLGVPIVPGAGRGQAGVEEVEHPLLTSWAHRIVPTFHSFITSPGYPPEIWGIPPAGQRWARYKLIQEWLGFRPFVSKEMPNFFQFQIQIINIFSRSLSS